METRTNLCTCKCLTSVSVFLERFLSNQRRSLTVLGEMLARTQLIQQTTALEDSWVDDLYHMDHTRISLITPSMAAQRYMSWLSVWGQHLEITSTEQHRTKEPNKSVSKTMCLLGVVPLCNTKERRGLSFLE